jgi:hypothetical protein
MKQRWGKTIEGRRKEEKRHRAEGRKKERRVK